MTTFESMGMVVKLTSEYLSEELTESAIHELKNLAYTQPPVKETLEALLRWVDLPVIWVRDIISVSLEAIPASPGSEHLLKLLILARFQGGQRTYEIHMDPEDANKLASEIESLIKKRF